MIRCCLVPAFGDQPTHELDRRQRHTQHVTLSYDVRKVGWRQVLERLQVCHQGGRNGVRLIHITQCFAGKQRQSLRSVECPELQLEVETKA